MDVGKGLGHENLVQVNSIHENPRHETTEIGEGLGSISPISMDE